MSFEVLGMIGFILWLIKTVSALAVWILLFLLIFKKNRKKTLGRMLLTVLIMGCCAWGEEKVAHHIIDNGIIPQNKILYKYIKGFIQEKQESKVIPTAQPPIQQNTNTVLAEATNMDASSEEDSYKDNKERLVKKITTINGKEVSFGDTYEQILNLLGEPDEQNYADGQMDLTYGDVILHLTDFFNMPGDDDIQLTNIERVDLFHTTKDVFSSLGEPIGEESSEDLHTTILKYDVDGYLFRAYEEDDATISKIDFCIPD